MSQIAQKNPGFNQVKGRIFEIIVKKLLEKNEYKECRPDGEQSIKTEG
ncbi:MAG: hypothetical protein QXJ31_02695 [Candidatus Bathyarchaeia archaeon]